MKTTILALFLSAAGLVSAQTTINVSVTVDDATKKILNAWIESDVNCATKDSKNACIAHKYANLKALISRVAADAVNSTITTAAQWAIDANDPSLPNSVTNAINSATSATATIRATKEAKASVQ